jgi:hypothetical protein
MEKVTKLSAPLLVLYSVIKVEDEMAWSVLRMEEKIYLRLGRII